MDEYQGTNVSQFHYTCDLKLSSYVTGGDPAPALPSKYGHRLGRYPREPDGQTDATKCIISGDTVDRNELASQYKSCRQLVYSL